MKPWTWLAALVVATVPLFGEAPDVVSDSTTTSAGELILYVSFVTTASPEKLWKALTLPDELSKWAARKARVELRVGGAYEYYTKPEAPVGRRGMEGMRIQSYIPNKMLSFAGASDWWTVYLIEPAGDQQVLHLYAVGASLDWSEQGGGRMPGLVQQMEKLAKYVQP